MIGRKLFLIGEEATLPFILIGKNYIWPLSERHAYLYAVKQGSTAVFFSRLSVPVWL
jgi:hypothetical protein